MIQRFNLLVSHMIRKVSEPGAAACNFVLKELSPYSHSYVGMRGLCWNNFENNRCV